MPGKDIGIDLGTSTITVYAKGKGILLHEKNALAVDARTKEVLCVGNEAYALLDRAPDTLELCRPMRDGVISDFSVMQQILTMTLEKICGNGIFRPNVIITAPSGITALEKRTILSVAVRCGAGKVCLLDAPIASALGAGVSISKPHGVMVVDIGAGTADIALITMGTVAYTSSLRTAGDSMDEAIQRYLRRERNMLVGLPTAEKIKRLIGCAALRNEEVELSVNGKDAIMEQPATFPVTSTEIYHALKEIVDQLIDGILAVLEETPPELYSDVCEEGILLTGGGSQLYGLDEAIESRLKIKVHTAYDGAHCAAKGAGYALRYIKKLEDNGYVFRLKNVGKAE